MKPILFNTEMTRAIQNSEKSVTRRVIKGVPETAHIFLGINPETQKAEFLCGEIRNGICADFGVEIALPYKVGDILYVRETFALYDCKKDCPALKHTDFKKCTEEPNPFYIYKTNACVQSPCGVWETPDKWTPSIHMPKEAARIFLRVTDVRVERLRNITLEQARKEGCINPMRFDKLWNSTVKKSDLAKYGWDANPWILVIEFERISKEEAYNG